MTVEQFPGRSVEVDGRSYLYFGGTSYLGMATHPDFQKLLTNSIQRWGTAYGSSRNSNIKLSIYKDAEALLSQIVGAEAALTVSSGTLAGKLVLDYLAKDHEHFYHHPKTHPAVLSTTSKALFVDGKLHPRLMDEVEESIVITADAILSMAVLPTSFDFLNDIPAHKHITLVIDESHSLGLVGEDGNGIFKTLNHPKIKRKLMISSLTKGYGCSGGMIAGDQDFIERIQKDATFISASGMNPIFLQTFFEAQELFQYQLKKLRENLHEFQAGSELPSIFKYDINYPVIYCDSNDVFEYLKSKDILITNFKYPNYEAMMNRIVITASHTQEDLKRLKWLLMQFGEEVLR